MELIVLKRMRPSHSWLNAKRVCQIVTVTSLSVGCTPPGTGSSFQRAATIRVLAKTDGRAPTGPVPLVLEASYDASKAGRVCLGLAAAPGTVAFPFGKGVPGDVGAAGAGAEAGDGPSDTQFNTAFAWATIDSAGSAEDLGAYLPKGNEPSAAVFGALYLNGCGGNAAAEVAITLQLGSTAPDDAGVLDGGSSGGTGGAGDGGPLDGGADEGGSQMGAVGGAGASPDDAGASGAG